MATGDFSTDSEDLLNAMTSPGRSSRRRSQKTVNDRVENLANTLHDTNRNLKAVDRMLIDYQSLGDVPGSTGNKYDDPMGSPAKIREKRYHPSSHDSQGSRSLRPSDLEDDRYGAKDRRRRGPTSPHRDYEHMHTGREYRGSPRRSSSAAVRFYDDMDPDDNLHGVHQSIRDLTSDQLRLEDDMEREISRRNRLEYENKKIRELAENVKKPEIDKVMTSVDKRLQSIQDEIHAERLMLKKADKLSGDLKQALEQQKSTQDSPSTGVEAELRAKLSNTISDKMLVENELQRVEQKLQQSDGRCQTLICQMDGMRKLLSRSDEEKNKFRSYYEQSDNEMRTQKKLSAVEEQERTLQQKDKRHLEDEIQTLRDQLTRSATHITEAGELRKDYNRSEKQRIQLSDHIETLQRDSDDKEKLYARVVTQLHELSEKYELSEQHKHQALLQLEDTMKRFRDSAKEVEELNRELHDSQNESSESIRKNEEIKARAQETVKQWKLKCKKLERDLDKYRNSAEQAQSRGEQIVKDFEASKSQSNTSIQQLEHLKREFAELLGIRAQQDEQVRLKDVQVNELKSIKMDLENDLRDCKMVIERLEQELHTMRERIHATNEDKDKMEDQLSVAEAAKVLVENQAKQLQSDLREASKSRSDLAGHLSHATKENQELKIGLKEIRRCEITARENMEALQKRLKEEKEIHHRRIEAISSELNQYKSQESSKVIEITRQYKKEKVEREAELQAVKLELNEERNNVRHVKRQIEKFKVEVDSLTENLAQSQEENTLLENQYLYLREELITKSQLTEDGLIRARDVELELLDSKEKKIRMEKEYQNIIHVIGAQVDSVIEVAAFDSVETYKALSLSKGLNSQPKKLLAEVQSKLHWLKNHLRENRQSEIQLKSSVRDVVVNNEKDREFLIAEIKRQSEVLEDFTSSQKGNDYVSRERDVDQHVEKNGVQRNGFSSDEEDRLHVDELSSTPQRKIMQRNQIHERYARLQNTVDSLRHQLSLPSKFPKDHQNQNGIMSNGKTTPNSTPKKVRISSPPEMRSPVTIGSPCTKKSAYTPPPLSLTDEEFNERFIPKSPHLSPHRYN